MIFCFSSRYGSIKALKIAGFPDFPLIISHRKHWTFSNGPPANETHRFQHVGVLRNTNDAFLYDNLTFCRFFPEFPSHNYFWRNFQFY